MRGTRAMRNSSEAAGMGRERRVGGWGPKTDRIHDGRQFRFWPSASFATEI